MKRNKAEKIIHGAARCIKTRLLVASGGRLPRSLAGWHRLCLKLGVEPAPLFRSPSRFRARLIVTEQGAFAFYNRYADARTICRWLAHELAEKMALDDLPTLFDAMPMIADYSGGTDPYKLHHRIAQRVEVLCFRK
ncbi:MAG: hypothetical protein ACRYFS_17320 [Janthinobacterium lividum]